MIDFGLVSLFVVTLGLVAMAFHVWRGMKVDVERISRMDLEIRALVKGIEEQVKQALTVAEGAAGLPKAQVKRIDALETETVQLEDKFTRLTARVNIMKRWNKEPEEVTPEIPLPEPEAVRLYQQQQPPAPQQKPPGFGKKRH